MHSGFPGDDCRFVEKLAQMAKIEQATMSFGYGLQLSLLQLARAILS